MTESTLTKLEIEELERLIDGKNIKNVLTAVSEICGDKAEHIAVNWQDAHLAKRWAKMAIFVGLLAPKAAGL